MTNHRKTPTKAYGARYASGYLYLGKFTSSSSARDHEALKRLAEEEAEPGDLPVEIVPVKIVELAA